jgi:hypothetical protein
MDLSRVGNAGPARDRVAPRSERGPMVVTIGHGVRPIGAFLAGLRWASITVLIDIRRFPGHAAIFGRDSLAGAGIGYHWPGEALGGRRSRTPHPRHAAGTRWLDPAAPRPADGQDQSDGPGSGGVVARTRPVS